jgi:hypothetical protein
MRTARRGNKSESMVSLPSDFLQCDTKGHACIRPVDEQGPKWNTDPRFHSADQDKLEG